jgi:DNA topoisomerase VI subunit B
MALRAFRSNPGLGGFGGESSDVAIQEQDCDAFAQILKELVDNAVDACSSTSNTEPKRVRVTIERFEEKEVDNELLEVTVTDNGGGMQNIHDCVEAFRTTKGRDEGKTAGRYGIGLTLCLLHAQRLVPNHYATITSATATHKHFTKASYVVDTEGDKVQCVKREKLPKNSPMESGTAVKLLVPVSDRYDGSRFYSPCVLGYKLTSITGRSHVGTCLAQTCRVLFSFPIEPRSTMQLGSESTNACYNSSVCEISTRTTR